MSQLQQQLAEAHTAAQQSDRDVAAATEASRGASAALAAAEAAHTQLQQQLCEVQGQVHSKGSELTLLRECMEACKGSLQQQVIGLQTELRQQRSCSEELQRQCDQAACSRESELAQVRPFNDADAKSCKAPSWQLYGMPCPCLQAVRSHHPWQGSHLPARNQRCCSA